MIYLTAMTVRLFEMKRLLKSTGSIYLHCDLTANHYLKLIMDSRLWAPAHTPHRQAQKALYGNAFTAINVREP